MPEPDGQRNVVKATLASGQPSSKASAPGPLSADQLDELELGRKRAAKIRRAAGVAALSGWSMAIFALCSFAFGLSGDWSSMAAGIVLAAAAFNELKGGERLKRFEPGAATQLGYGQLALGVLIVAYAAWSWYAETRHASATSYGSAEVDEMVRGWTSTLTPIVWGSVGALGLVICWLTASYYFSRGKLVRQLRERTPAWVVDVLKRAG